MTRRDLIESGMQLAAFVWLAIISFRVRRIEAQRACDRNAARLREVL